MKNFFEIKKKANQLLSISEDNLRKAGYEDNANDIAAAAKDMTQKSLIIVTIGEIKRGKSSLINALLGEPDLMPVDDNVATNAITIVEYAKEEHIEVVYSGTDDEESRTKTITRDEIAEYVSEQGNSNNYKNVETLRISTPNEFLKEGIILVDTPGVGSMNVAHAEATNAFLPMADLLIFTGDSMSGYTETELNFLKRGYKLCKNIVFPITKMDLNPNYAEIVEDNRQKIHNLLDIPMDKIKLIPVSNLAKLRYLETGSKLTYRNSNFAEFEKVLWNSAAEAKVKKCIIPYTDIAAETLSDVADSVKMEYDTLNSDNAEKTGQIIEQLNAQKDKFSSLQSDSSKWQSKLNLISSELSNLWKNKLQAVSNDAQDVYNDAISKNGIKACKEKEYMEIFQQVNEVLVLGIDDAKCAISDAVEHICIELVSELDLDITVNTNEIKDMDNSTSKDFKVNYTPKKTTDRVVKIGRNITFTTSALGTLGGIIGGLAGTIIAPGVGTTYGAYIGGTIGSFLGGTKGFYDGIQKYDNVDVNKLTQAFTKYVSNVITANVSNGNLTITKIISDLKTQFVNELKKKEGSLKKSISNITDNIKLSQDAANKKKKELKAKYDKLMQQLNKLKEFSNLIDNIEIVEQSKESQMTDAKSKKSEKISEKPKKIQTVDTDSKEELNDFLHVGF